MEVFSCFRGESGADSNYDQCTEGHYKRFRTEGLQVVSGLRRRVRVRQEVDSLSLHDPLPVRGGAHRRRLRRAGCWGGWGDEALHPWCYLLL